MDGPSKARLVRSVEEACLNGWPAIRELVFDGWLLRFSHGHTRRANSVIPLAAGNRPAEDKIRYCERVYAAQGLPIVFCLPTTAQPLLGHVLDGMGYGPPEDETRVLHRGLSEGKWQMPNDVSLKEGLPSEAWLQTLARLQGQTDAARKAHRAIVERLPVPAVFAAVPVGEGRLGALAFGAVHDGIVCVNSVATDPAFQRRGFARKAVSAVLAWARIRQDAEGACVPVAAGNAPASALYAGLGFQTEAYRYHYRRRVA